MLKRSLAITIGCLALAGLGHGQKPHTPKQGSQERKAIMNAMRAPCEKMLGQKVIFVVSHLKVAGSWAFSTGVPRRPDGKKIDYRKTRYKADVDAGMFDEGYCSLLRKTGQVWKVKRFLMGMTDVPWVEWDKEFGAPKGIFPK